MRTPKQVEQAYTDKELQEMINEIPRWWHTIQLSTNIQTPGIYDKKMWANILKFIPKDLSGKTVLDIGTADGGWAFECERRNAKKVIAVDKFGTYGSKKFHFIDTRIKIVKKILDSNIKLIEMNVDDIHTLEEKFDLVLFLGVYYHLVNPLLAMQNLYKISNDLVIFEGEVVESKRNIAYVLEEGEPGGKFLFSPSFIKRYSRIVGFKKIEFLGYFQNGKDILSDLNKTDKNFDTLQRNRGIFYLWK